MLPNNGEAKGNLRAENRIKRRFARFKDRKDLKTTDPLVAELMLAQIDATLSVSHAIQELSAQLGIAGLEVMRQQPPLFGGKRETEIAIGTLQATARGFQQQIDNLERDIGSIRQSLGVLRDAIQGKTNSDTVTPEPIVVPPWWAFWRGW